MQLPSALRVIASKEYTQYNFAYLFRGEGGSRYIIDGTYCLHNPRVAGLHSIQLSKPNGYSFKEVCDIVKLAPSRNIYSFVDELYVYRVTDPLNYMPLAQNLDYFKELT